VHLPKELAWMTAHYSWPFYAILLRSVKAMPAENPTDECRGYFAEHERLKVQTMFPQERCLVHETVVLVLGWYGIQTSTLIIIFLPCMLVQRLKKLVDF
jgi:hypothetical protein